ncbi:hypothetical protein B0H66DRAFT_565802 [Apodospora peruviana]|uniref:Uncharacterized protein n=1 Tax=Apodospora peruviana TaxID=516989 RepID=A0AAE0HUS9_9PEZI|nr:hypothetical protein B0H66DRAFT_565802 [Apodospora peruviana]
MNYIGVDDGYFTCRQELHTRHATPQRLRQELAKLLGTAQWRVEMRHNVYNIRSSADFDIKDLLWNCHNAKTPRNTEETPEKQQAALSATPRRVETPQLDLTCQPEKGETEQAATGIAQGTEVQEELKPLNHKL